MRSRISKVFHLAEASNLPSILEHGLMSTKRLLDLARVPDADQADRLRSHRPDNERLSGSVMIRDQKPMPPSALERALEDGLTPGDWYAHLNDFVFFWLDVNRMERQRRACGDRPQVLLTFDAASLLDQFGTDAFVSPINSGNARRKPARRGLSTLMPYSTWLLNGWPAGTRHRPPVELLFRSTIPVEAPYLMEMRDL
ncbi:hypothetical protein HF263_30705 [Rhizobium leguminosarum]|uniref:DUF7002 family protein n=1 Tax=Rhizobium leguminosarum TaxID=384 RepID=UPI001C919722|nr:hypothetical protein [Rhizobium leguminosarum]MBY3060380.1 hypothetical protein [Rhizobium leguminosarum]